MVFANRPRRTPAVLAALAAAAAAASACSSDAATSPGSGSGCATTNCQVSATSAVGDTVLLNVRVEDGASSDNVGAGAADCGTPNRVKARIAAISNKAVIVVDTRNPASGLTDAYYAGIAQTFDTLVYPTDVRHFGAPFDIDNNGRVIAFYTRTVNGLTPANSGFYIGGFFYARDILPTTGANACAGSNAAEMFYLLAPDPNGEVNGNVRSSDFVSRITVGTIAHEFQHLISAERRLYGLSTQNFDEEVWLNEGMSHIAEELNFYRSANLSPAGQPGQSPRARLTATSIASLSGGLAALNGFQYQNLVRFSTYLAATETFSPYTHNDSLQTRGATWSFLRYALDRAGSTDSALTYPLVNSVDTGLVNLRAVLAAHGGASASVPLETWFRDYAVSNYADVIAPVAAQYTQPSWNFRSVLTGFSSGSQPINGGVYPLATRALGTTQTIALTGGGATYLRFSVAAGSTTSLSAVAAGTASLPTAVRLALVQTTGANAGAVTTVDGTGSGAGTVSVANSSAAAIQAALVVFNAGEPATATQTVTVTATNVAAPLARLADARLGAVGPTVAALAAAREPVMSDAGFMARVAPSLRARIAPHASELRAQYLEARRTGDFRAWTRPTYLPGTVKGAVVRGAP